MKSVKSTSISTEMKTFQRLIRYCVRDHEIWHSSKNYNTCIIMNNNNENPGEHWIQHGMFQSIITVA